MRLMLHGVGHRIRHRRQHQHPTGHRGLTQIMAPRHHHSRGRTATGEVVVVAARPRTWLAHHDHSRQTAAATWTPAASNRGSCLTSEVSRRRATIWSPSRSTTSTPTRVLTLLTSSQTARSTSTDRRRSDAAWKTISQLLRHRTAYISPSRPHFDLRPPVPRTPSHHQPPTAACLTATSDL